MLYESPYTIALARIKELEQELAKETKLRQAYEDALNPNCTKYAYIGEVKFTIPDMRLDEETDEWDECYREVVIPWESTKEIMQMIKDRANG